ncbi:hypothetical protein ACHAWC_007576 [Mediolabrus comicus]
MAKEETKKRKVANAKTPAVKKSKAAIVTTSKKGKTPEDERPNGQVICYVIDLEAHVEDVVPGQPNPKDSQPNPKENLIVQVHIERLDTEASLTKHVCPPGFSTLSVTSTNIMVPADSPDRDEKIRSLNKNINDASAWPKVLDEIMEFIKNDSKGREVALIAWNGLRYDFPLMEVESIRNLTGIHPSTYINHYVDAMLVCENHSSFSESNAPTDWKLLTVYQYLFQSTFQGHDAKADSVAMKRVLLRMFGDDTTKLMKELESAFCPVSYSDKKLDELMLVGMTQKQTCELAKGSIQREKMALSSAVYEEDVCKEIIQGVRQSQILPKDELKESAQLMGCIQLRGNTTEYPNYYHKGTGRYYHLHVVACTAKNGARKLVTCFHSNYDSWETASHRCANPRCINGDHLCWESLKKNIDRQGCAGYAIFGDNKMETGCTHRPRCLTFVTSNGVCS